MSASRPRIVTERLGLVLKPASWPKLVVPALLGHALGVDATGSLSLAALAVGLVLVALDIVFVVCLNDWADQEIDALKRRMFPESSLKTIPDGIASSRTLLLAGLFAGALALLVALVAAPLLDRPHLFVLTLGALGVFWLYSLPPLRLNYRGGGELLEALGVGVVLPLLSAYLQSGVLVPPSATLLLGWTCLSLGSAIASGLSDERSDRAGGKHTVVTMLGNETARTLVQGLTLLGPLLWVGAAFLHEGGPPRMIGLLAAAVAFDEWWTLRKRSGEAVTDAFGALQHYKAALHALIWRAGLAWAVGLTVAPLLGL